MNHEKFLGSSQWRFDTETNTLLKKHRDIEKKSFPNIEFKDLTEFEQECTNEILRVRQAQSRESYLNMIMSKRPKKTVYVLNKKKVREKCSAFFGLRQSRKFLAFYSISFPMGLEDSYIMQCYNTFLTRCRKKMRLNNILDLLIMFVMVVISRFLSVFIERKYKKFLIKLKNKKIL